jgi:hypothetical protein
MDTSKDICRARLSVGSGLLQQFFFYQCTHDNPDSLGISGVKLKLEPSGRKSRAQCRFLARSIRLEAYSVMRYG